MCDDLLNPANGRVAPVGTGVGDTAEYSCNTGYRLVGNDAVTCLLRWKLVRITTYMYRLVNRTTCIVHYVASFLKTAS